MSLSEKDYRKLYHQIADDFLLGNENTLGITKTDIKDAKPLNNPENEKTTN